MASNALYSRQVLVYGAAAQEALSRAHLLVIGLNALGQEAAKNIVLAGVKSISLYDPALVSPQDLDSFVFTPSDVHTHTRSTCVASFLEPLNDLVQVLDLATLPTDMSMYAVVIAVNQTRDTIQKLAQKPPCLVSCGAYGLYTYAFSDFGEEWVVHDADGEVEKSGLVLRVVEGVFETDTKHGLSENDRIKVVNTGSMYTVHLLTSAQGLVDQFRFLVDEPFKGNPLEAFYFEQVKSPRIVSHKRFDDSSPSFVPYGFELDPVLMHAYLQGLWDFQTAHNAQLPEATSEEEAKELVSLVHKYHECTEDQAEQLTRLARGACAVLPPIAAFMGGGRFQH